MDSKKLRWLDH